MTGEGTLLQQPCEWAGFWGGILEPILIGCKGEGQLIRKSFKAADALRVEKVCIFAIPSALHSPLTSPRTGA